MRAAFRIALAKAVLYGACTTAFAETERDVLADRYEAGKRAIAEHQKAQREMLTREYSGRLARFARYGRWRPKRAAEATAERKRFEAERTPKRGALSNDPEVSRLQAILAGALSPLDDQQRESMQALTNAYLYRLAMANDLDAARDERARLSAEISIPPLADGSTDLVPGSDSRAEVFAIAEGETLRFDLDALADVTKVYDARLRLVCSSRQPDETRAAHRIGETAWAAPEAYAIAIVDLTEATIAALGSGNILEIRLEGATHYAKPDHESLWARPRLLVNDVSAAMAPRDSDGALPRVEVFPPWAPRR